MSSENPNTTENEIFVTRASLPPMEEYIAMLRPLWESARLTNMGPYHEALREALCAYLGVGGVELLVNGHMALELCIQAFGLTGEVITTPFSFASTTHALVRNGLKPVFCDINERDYTLDVDRLEACITERTSAILPVHVYGNLCDVAAIEDIARRHGLRVIYDAAHCFGESLNKTPVGCFGDASMFSFHATKVFHSIEGGAICTAGPAPELMRKLYELKNFGILDQETVAEVGSNGKMNEFCAAMGLCNLRHVDEYIRARGRLAALYRSRLSGVDGLYLCPEQPGVQYNYAYMPLRVHGYACSRDELFDRLAAAGIHARKYFYPCINEYECYRTAFLDQPTPVASQVSREILTLPIYPELTEAEAERICQLILAVGGRDF